MESDVQIFCYNDYEKICEKIERLQMYGFFNLHYMNNEMVYDYYHILDKLLDTKVYSKEFITLMKNLVQLWNTKYDFPRFYRPHNREYILTEMEKIAKVYDILEDDFSKKSYENILKYRFSGENKYLSEIVTENQYFQNDIFGFTDNEVMIDGGAAQGDTAIKFIKLCGGQYSKIYSFEANQEYCKGMKYCFKNENVEVINKGIFNKKANLFWHENGHGSFLSESLVSDINIKVDSIDNLIKDNVTYIKMDIEGSEVQALVGAERLIKKDNPKLAICIYHKENDLWEIPLLIKKLNPQYKIYIRQHYDIMDEETVCYACL